MSIKLTAYVLDGHQLDIRPAPLERDWMEKTGERFAYRCLPLDIANAYGWEILCPSGFEAIWSGSEGLDAIGIVPDVGTKAPVLSHFGSGVLTFHVPCLFSTEAGFDLMVQGPINRPKDAIAALSGIIETDWSPYTFTMNWIFTSPEVPVRFEKGEPYCHLFPVRRGEIETVKPEIRLLSSNPELAAMHDRWKANRAQFNRELMQPGSQAQAERWQKLYHRGLDPQGKTAGLDHRTRLRLKPFSAPDA